MKTRPILFSGPMVRALLDGSKTQTRRVLNPQPVWVSNWGIAVGMNGAWRVGSPAAMGLSERGDHWSATFDAETIRRYATAEAYGWGARAGCPYGQPGDRLYVRETWAPDPPADGTWAYTAWAGCKGSKLSDIPERFRTPKHCMFAADHSADTLNRLRWTPSIHMPRWACRILLEIVSVRVEKLNDCSDADAIAEGIDRVENNFGNGRAYCDYNLARLDDTAEWFSSPVHSYRSLWESINGAGSWSANPWVWVVEFKRITPPAPGTLSTKCWCETCRPNTWEDQRFIVCPDCGNKRCPKATNHENACTGSNEPGQKGSSWENYQVPGTEGE